MSVYALSTCSFNENDSDESLVDFSCLGDTTRNLDEEAFACEKVWIENQLISK